MHMKVDSTIQQCTVVLDTPINFASFHWVHLLLSSTLLTPSSMNSAKYLGTLPEFFWDNSLGELIMPVACMHSACFHSL